MSEDFYCDEVLSGRTSVEMVFETPNVLAYHHTRPFYPVHVVVIPKKHIPSLVAVEEVDNDTLCSQEMLFLCVTMVIYGASKNREVKAV